MQQQRSGRGGSVILFLIGIFGLVFLILSAVDGVIYIHGDGVARAEHPVAFWTIVALLGPAFTSLTYAGVRSWRSGKSSSTP